MEDCCDDEEKETIKSKGGKMNKKIDELAAENIKRIIKNSIKDWYSDDAQSPYFITDVQETKTTWHPVGF